MISSANFSLSSLADSRSPQINGPAGFDQILVAQTGFEGVTFENIRDAIIPVFEARLKGFHWGTRLDESLMLRRLKNAEGDDLPSAIEDALQLLRDKGINIEFVPGRAPENPLEV